jgi:hypothetical protein
VWDGLFEEAKKEACDKARRIREAIMFSPWPAGNFETPADEGELDLEGVLTGEKDRCVENLSQRLNEQREAKIRLAMEQERCEAAAFEAAAQVKEARGAWTEADRAEQDTLAAMRAMERVLRHDPAAEQGFYGRQDEARRLAVEAQRMEDAARLARGRADRSLQASNLAAAEQRAVWGSRETNQPTK